MIAAPGRMQPLAHLWSARIDDHAIDLAWTPDGAMLAAAEVSGKVWLFDARTGQSTSPIGGHDFGTTSIDWSADGTRLATGGQDGHVRLWDRDAKPLAALAAGAPWVGKVAWSRSAPLLAGCAGRLLQVWNTEGTVVATFPPFASTIADIAWVPRTGEIAAAGYGGVGIYRPEAPQACRRLDWKGSVLALAWSPAGTYLAAGNQDASVHLWVTSTGEDLHMGGYALKVRELAWSPDGRLLATGGASDVVVWNCSGKGPAGTHPVMLAHHRAPISQLAWQHRGRLLASACQEGMVAVWRPGKHKAPTAVARMDEAVSRLAWSADDRSLAVATAGGSVTVLASPA